MRLAHDTLRTEERGLLMEFARRLEPHTAEVTAEWVDAIESALMPPNFDRDAYRQMLRHFVVTSLEAYVRFVGSGDLEAMYAFQYSTNRDGAARSLHEGSMPLYATPDVHLAMRVAAPVITRWIERLFADDERLGLRVQVAQERLGAQLGMILSEAYGDAREARLREFRDELARSLDVSERLSSVGQAVVRSLDSEPVLDLALHTAVQLLGADGAALWLPNRERTELHVHRLIGGDDADRGLAAAIGESLSGWAYQTNQPVRSLRALPESHRARVAAALRQRGIETFLLVPLRAAGEPIGVLGVNCRAKRRFAAPDEKLLQSLADYVAIAVENARVHGEVREALREMERLNHAKSEFVAAVSHELRSPLSAVIGYVQIMREGGFGAVSAEQEATLVRLESIAESTLQLTNDLLDHARADAGALPVRIETVLLAPLLGELGETVRMLIGQRPISFVVLPGPDADSVRADPVRLRQILINLLTNAVKFTERGSVTLTTAPSADGSAVEFTVVDTGGGIEARDLPRIFDLFYRADGHASVSGAGIGLALSRQLAILMHGRLEVTSEVGRGTRFVLTLPV